MLRPAFSPALLLLTAAVASAAEKDTRLFELRTVTAEAGKLDAINARMKKSVIPMYAKHGATPIAFFTPLDGKTDKVVYLLAFKDFSARTKTMAAVEADPDWKAMRAESEKSGTAIKGTTSSLLTATDYSPVLKAEAGAKPRVFELRTYTATPGNLGHLNDRFRNHTLKLFEKHGMTNIAYWDVANVEQPKSNTLKREDTLIYLLAHDSQEAARTSFGNFGRDPLWTAARTESEKKGGGSLTAKGGVKSEFLKATDYSPLK